MARHKQFQADESIIPNVETGLFNSHPQSRFGVGLVAIGNRVLEGRDSEYLGYLRLRANVYAIQTRMIPIQKVNQDGTESDRDDYRSVHFAVLENVDFSRSFARVVGCMRLIVKDIVNDGPLPIEHYFPEAFKSSPAPPGSVELSRFICRHEQARIQHAMKWPLFNYSLGYGKEAQYRPVYATVEPSFERLLRAIGILEEQVASPSFITDYNADNLGIKINISRLEEKLNDRELVDGLYRTALEFAFYGQTGMDGLVAGVSSSCIPKVFE